MNNKELRLGLTMRIIDAVNYTEPRDALAHDWGVFMKKVLPQAGWIPVPNLGYDVIDYVKRWQLNGFILTGGNNLFEAKLRDETEFALLEYAIRERLPVLGVCRGMQFMCHYFGQDIFPCPDTSRHVATNHRINLIDSLMQWKEELQVNSYHEYCAGLAKTFKASLLPFAVSEDGLVEGVKSGDEKLLGIMWHPERINPASRFDEYLIKNFFDQKGD